MLVKQMNLQVLTVRLGFSFATKNRTISNSVLNIHEDIQILGMIVCSSRIRVV